MKDKGIPLIPIHGFIPWIPIHSQVYMDEFQYTVQVYKNKMSWEVAMFPSSKVIGWAANCIRINSIPSSKVIGLKVCYEFQYGQVYMDNGILWIQYMAKCIRKCIKIMVYHEFQYMVQVYKDMGIPWIQIHGQVYKDKMSWEVVMFPSSYVIGWDAKCIRTNSIPSPK